ncbi:unnamed protein product, partial [Didymodactylos carnosus]
MSQAMEPYSYLQYQQLYGKDDEIASHLERYVSFDSNTSLIATYTTTLRLQEKNVEELKHHLFEFQDSLVSAKVINWCNKVKPLYSLKTTVNEQQAQLNDLVGIYLPLLTTNTHHHPIVLSYCHNHFTPLVISENESPSSLKSSLSSAARPLLPLSFWSCSNESARPVLVNLPVHYTNYLEELNIINLLKKHLNIEDIITDEGLLVRCCALNEERLPEDMNLLDKYVNYLQENMQPETPEVDSSKPDDL